MYFTKLDTVYLYQCVCEPYNLQIFHIRVVWNSVFIVCDDLLL